MTTPIDSGEITIAQFAVRKYVDGTVYGHLVDDQHCQDIAVEVVNAIEAYRSGKEI